MEPRQQAGRPAGNQSGPGWLASAALRDAKARSSPTSSPIFLKNLPNAGSSGSCQRTTRLPASSAPRQVALANHWLHKGGIVLHFSGVESINDAETLTGLIVAIPRTERAALAADEVYIGDLIGCALVDVAGSEPNVIGEIEEVDRTAGPVALLVVRAPGASRRNPRPLRKKLSAQSRPRRQTRRDGPARRAYRFERTEKG